MSNELSVIEKLDIFLSNREDKFVTLNETVRPLNFAAECDFARQALMKNDFLLKVAKDNQQSLADAISNVAAIGISLNPANKHAYLVPRKKTVCLDISYMGMIKLATDTGIVKYMKAELVYENDNFTYRGFDTRPEIEVKNPFDAKSRGALIGCIAWAKLNSGDFLNEYMNINEINAIRNDSEAYKYGFGKGEKSYEYKSCVWVKHEGEMQKKTLIKRLYKTLPSSDGSEVMAHAIEVLNEHEGIEFDQQPQTRDYTEHQSDAYKEALDKGDYVGLICVTESLDYVEGQGQLYNRHESPNIPKGQKGKYTESMRTKLADARDQRDEILAMILVACDSVDDVALQEAGGDDLSQYTIDWYCNKLNPEQERFARGVFEQLEAA